MMALFIQQARPSAPKEWHIGESLPEIKSKVVTFQADDDELEIILAALRKTRPSAHVETLTQLQHVELDHDLFPVLVYEYRQDGFYLDPEKVYTLLGLNTWMKANLQKILQEKRELRITDMGDRLCFHAHNGEILYDGKNHYDPGSGYGRQP